MWNLCAWATCRLKLVLGTAVYSLGIVGGLKAAFKSFSRGEISELTTLIYDAREHAIGLITARGRAIGADDVVGIKTHIHEHGNLIEFLAIGTAVKRYANVQPLTRDPAAAGDHPRQGHLDRRRLVRPEHRVNGPTRGIYRI